MIDIVVYSPSIAELRDLERDIKQVACRSAKIDAERIDFRITECVTVSGDSVASPYWRASIGDLKLDGHAVDETSFEEKKIRWWFQQHMIAVHRSLPRTPPRRGLREPVIEFTVKRTKRLEELTPLDVPRGMDPYDVALLPSEVPTDHE